MEGLCPSGALAPVLGMVELFSKIDLSKRIQILAVGSQVVLHQIGNDKGI